MSASLFTGNAFDLLKSDIDWTALLWQLMFILAESGKPEKYVQVVM